MLLDNRLLLTGDYHRNAGCMYNRGTHRAEQHAAETAPAVAADHDQLCRFGLVEQTAGRVIKHNPMADRDVWVVLLKTG